MTPSISWIMIIGVSMPHLVATGLAGAALALLPSLPAGTAAATATEAPRASLVLNLTHPDSRGPAQRSVNLRCGPSGGSHPRAAAACAELRRSRGVIEHPPAPGTSCTMIHAPVIAEATGHWHGRRVRFHAEYGNRCHLTARTGSVFRF